MQNSLEIGDRSGEQSALGNLGNTYSNLGNTSKAIECYEKALFIAKEIGNRQCEGLWLNNLGAIYKKLGEKNKSRELFQESLYILDEIESPLGDFPRNNLAILE